jgi:hypothetical protein
LGGEAGGLSLVESTVGFGVGLTTGSLVTVCSTAENTALLLVEYVESEEVDRMGFVTGDGVGC